MDVYRTEDEQVAAIKSWYQRHGTKVMAALAAVLVLYFGYQYYQNKQQSELDKASILYTQLLRVMDSVGLEDKQNKMLFDEIYGYLSTDYPKSIYASYAALIRASLDVKNNDYEKAEQTLEWVLQQKAAKEIHSLARLRLARVKAANGEAEEALALLAKGSAMFEAEYAEAQGDIYYDQKKREEAREAYQKAKSLSANKRSGTLLDMKIDSLHQDPEAIINVKL